MGSFAAIFASGMLLLTIGVITKNQGNDGMGYTFMVMSILVIFAGLFVVIRKKSSSDSEGK